MQFRESWMEDYERGTALELYYRSFSPYFYEMTFAQACEFCYKRLRIVLIAVQNSLEFTDSPPQVFPHPKYLITRNMAGYFLADHREEVQR